MCLSVASACLTSQFYSLSCFDGSFHFGTLHFVGFVFSCSALFTCLVIGRDNLLYELADIAAFLVGSFHELFELFE